MRATIRLIATALLVTGAACSPAGGPASTASDAATPGSSFPALPPTWTPTPPLVLATETPSEPTATPLPTRTLTPPVTPDEFQVIVAANNAFSIQIPANWTITQSTRRVQGVATYEVKYFAAVGPGEPPQPGVIIFYDWPSSLAVTNDNAWESAFALTALVIKTCGMRLSDEKLPVDFGGEPAFGVEYVDACGAAGLLTGAVHNGVNYGALFEAPAPYFGEWFETLRQILLSITFGR